MKKTIYFILIILLAPFGFVNAQSYKIIVNSGNSTSSISKKEVSDLFLKKKTKWGTGTAVTPVDQVINSKVREAFTQEVHKKPLSAVRSFWQQAAFSGEASAPPEKANDLEVIEFVKTNPGAIGYVSTTAPVSDVKVLTLN